MPLRLCVRAPRISIFSVLTKMWGTKSKPDTIRALAKINQIKMQKSASAGPMNRQEKTAVSCLAGIFAVRMFGLFLLLPVLAVHAGAMQGSTASLIGLALGIYGLTQALLQIPFGLLSDRIGRKKVIIAGLFIFVFGSVIAAMAETVQGVILGRAVQGAGAISAAILALAADLTREQQRTKAMAMIGISIGLVFVLSISIAPPLAGRIGVSGLFWITAVLATGAIALMTLVPSPVRHEQHRDVTPAPGQIREVLADSQLLRLDFGIFVLHLVLTALFVVLPGEISRIGQIEIASHWKIYLPVIILSVVGMVPLIISRSKKGRESSMFRVATVIVLLSMLSLYYVIATPGAGFALLVVSIWLFFTGFNALESMLPSLVSRVAPAASKGTAFGVYNSLQFFGVFVGGAAAGWLTGQYGSHAVFWLCGALVALWLFVSVFSAPFKLATTRVIRLPAEQSTGNTDALIARIRGVTGVQEVTIIAGESQAYLKVDEKELDDNALHAATYQ